jgi:hypothetical protein
MSPRQLKKSRSVPGLGTGYNMVHRGEVTVAGQVFDQESEVALVEVASVVVVVMVLENLPSRGQKTSSAEEGTRRCKLKGE